ncbi:MAG TPA: hypothetical protein VHH36_04360, partial [Candidatus Thermoplasmatota archaeon]|nr:hypothetical protein [Candidatus Thermoplasmatota archaeon]
PPPPPPPPPPVTSPTPPPPTPSPTPSPTPTPTSWPREGSHVSYRVHVGEGSPDGSYDADRWTNITWTYANGDWRGECVGQKRERLRDQPEQWTELRATFTASDPPHWPPFNTKSPPAVGGTVEAWFLQGCGFNRLDREYAGTDSRDGAPTFVATDFDDGSPDDFRTEWSQRTGLVLEWDWSQRHTRTTGRMTSTDAPLA